MKKLPDLPLPSGMLPFSNTHLIRKKILEMEQHSSQQSSAFKKTPNDLYQLTYSQDSSVDMNQFVIMSNHPEQRKQIVQNIQ
jgi:hypothetical protein